MTINRYLVAVLVAGLLVLAGCASTQEARERREAAEADIRDILNQSLASDGAGEPVRCLSESQFRSFSALGERYVVFKGRRDEYWVNTLRSRCSDLRYGSVMRVNRYTGPQYCDGDRFTVADLFDFPMGAGRPPARGTDVACVLGRFHPVSEEQVAEIEAALARK